MLNPLFNVPAHHAAGEVARLAAVSIGVTAADLGIRGFLSGCADRVADVAKNNPIATALVTTGAVGCAAYVSWRHFFGDSDKPVVGKEKICMTWAAHEELKTPGKYPDFDPSTLDITIVADDVPLYHPEMKIYTMAMIPKELAVEVPAEEPVKMVVAPGVEKVIPGSDAAKVVPNPATTA